MDNHNEKNSKNLVDLAELLEKKEEEKDFEEVMIDVEEDYVDNSGPIPKTVKRVVKRRALKGDDGTMFYFTFYPNKDDNYNISLMEVVKGFNRMLCIQKILTEKVRVFSAFKTYLELYKHLLNIVMEGRTYHEVILGNAPQKLRFEVDIDDSKLSLNITHNNMYFMGYNADKNKAISDDYNNSRDPFKRAHLLLLQMKEIGKTTINKLVDCIIFQFLISYKIILEPQQIMICPFHGPRKISYHVIIPGYYVDNYLEVSTFCLTVIRNMPPVLQTWINSNIYNKFSTFKILGSSELHECRFKVLDETWVYYDKEIGFTPRVDPKFEGLNEEFNWGGNEVIEEDDCGQDKRIQLKYLGYSLITCIVASERLPSIIPSSVSNDGGQEILEDAFKDAFLPAIEILEGLLKISGVFKLGKVSLFNDRYMTLILNRVKPSDCPVCNKEHTSTGVRLIWNIVTQEIKYRCYDNNDPTINPLTNLPKSKDSVFLCKAEVNLDAIIPPAPSSNTSPSTATSTSLNDLTSTSISPRSQGCANHKRV